MTPGQAKDLEIKESSVVFSTNNRKAKRNPYPSLSLKTATLEVPDDFDGSTDVKGVITCRITGKKPDRPVVRVSYRKKDSSTYTLSYPSTKASANSVETTDDGLLKVKFSLPEINSKSDNEKYYGPLPIFIDICAVKEQGGVQDIRIISNTIGRLIIVGRPRSDGASAPADSP